MSELLTITPAHQAARNAATVALADSGPAASRLQLFATLTPVPGDTVLATVTLAKPCGTVASDGTIALHQANPGGDLFAASGAALYALWFSGSGTVIAAGAVTDSAGLGPFKLAGTTGTNVYAGGLVLLGTTAIE